MKRASFGIVIKDNTLLLSKRLDVPIWVLPGGGVDYHESFEAACVREVKEETGLDVQIIRQTHALTPINCLAQPTHLFLCEGKGEITPNSDESSENRYFPLDKLPKNFFWPHKQWVSEALSSTAPITRDLTEITWLNLFFYLIKRPLDVLRFLLTRMTK